MLEVKNKWFILNGRFLIGDYWLPIVQFKAVGLENALPTW